jgi:hypothetical protein
MTYEHTWRKLAAAALLISAAAARVCGDVVEEANRALEAEDYRTAAALAGDELKVNPGNEEVYIILAEAQEALGEKEQAAETWESLKKITRVRDRVQQARIGLLRTRGPEVPKHNPDQVWENDPYKVDIGEVDWERIAQEVRGMQVNYVNDTPPELVESPSFLIYAATRRMGEVATNLGEKYTQFLLDKYFYAGQEWALRLPIYIFKDHADYVRITGAPQNSGGGTMMNPQTGMPELIIMYMLDKDGNLDRDALEGTLPHELVHMVIHEWFGGATIPRWIDEGLARRMEQTRNHYVEAARIGREAMAGEYFRFRDLFAQEQYPERGDRTFRFYEQSATIVLFLLEQFGPESAIAFFESLKQGGTHDDAAAAAMGIPVEGAVDEFEKRWLDWIRDIYVRFDKRLSESDIAQGTVLDASAYTANFAELPTAENVSRWNPVRTDSMNAFRDIGGSHRHWRTEGDKLACHIDPSEIGTIVGVRTNDDAPMVLKCTVRATSASVDTPTPFGVTMLDHRSDDTGLEVRGVLEDRRPHEVLCVVSDEIALYIDGECVGRSPALRDLGEDLDWPLGFVGYGPIEISNVQTAMIGKFMPLAAKGTP